MKNLIFVVALIFSFSVTAKPSRLKNLTTIKGVRENPIIGYGLVIGLNGTGDGGGEITNTSLKRMFQKARLNPQQEISSKNVAAVIVTAKIPPFGRIGQKIDVHVSSIGDASSLAGGTLLVTPLKAGDGNIYAVSSGQISIGGLQKVQNLAMTAGLIPGGATIERELKIDFDQKKSIRISLNKPDFTTSARIEKALNQELGGKYAIARDSSTVDLIIPVNYQRKVVQLIAVIENIKINTDQVAKIVINERTGTIVAGGEIVLKAVAISHGDLTIQIGEGEGNANEEAKTGSFYYMDAKNSLNELVKGLNALGTTPEDLISIFQALKRNGALVASIELI